MRSQTNYILGTDSCLFQNVEVRDARHNMDHYLVLGRFCGSTPAAQSRCLGNCTHFTIRTLATPDRVDHIFAEIRRAITRPTYQENHFQTWILPDTWSLIEPRIAELQQKYQQSS